MIVDVALDLVRAGSTASPARLSVSAMADGGALRPADIPPDDLPPQRVAGGSARVERLGDNRPATPHR